MESDQFSVSQLSQLQALTVPLLLFCVYVVIELSLLSLILEVVFHDEQDLWMI